MEIKGTNIVKDLKNARFQQVNLDEQFAASMPDNNNIDATLQKYLNYPLDQVVVRSNIDPETDMYSSQYRSINTHPSNLFRGNKKIPVYLKYCVELVLGEVGRGNIMTSNKKINHVKDLPIVCDMFSYISLLVTRI